jgi:hypothetical protein
LPDPIQITAPDGTLVAQIGSQAAPGNLGLTGIWADPNHIWIGATPGSGSGVLVTLDGPAAIITFDNSVPQIHVVDKASHTDLSISAGADSEGNFINLLFENTADPTNKWASLGYNQLVFRQVVAGQRGTFTAAQATLQDATNTTQLLAGSVTSPQYNSATGTGVSATSVVVTGITTSTETTAVKGTPGAGQSAFTAVTGLTLSTKTLTSDVGLVVGFV